MVRVGAVWVPPLRVLAPDLPEGSRDQDPEAGKPAGTVETADDDRGQARARGRVRHDV